MKEKYVPEAEIANRIVRLQHHLSREDIEAALVIYKMDYFYFSGTAQNAVLYVPRAGMPLLLVIRDIDRAKDESPLALIVPLDSIEELPQKITHFCGRIPRRIGLEFDVLPVRDYFRYQAMFPNAEFVDTAKIIKIVRKKKSPFELAQMRKAGEIGKKVFEEGCNLLREGMSELEFGALLEVAAKKLEHEGLVRMRSLNYEAYTWHVLSGPSGSMVSQADSPMGGQGLSPAFPVGAGTRKIQAHEPVLVDYGFCYNGYLVDQTRMYSIGELPDKYVKAYEASRKIERLALESVRPGAICGEIFQKTMDLAKALGYEANYLGIPGKKTSFVGHGIGLENNEIPFIAAKQPFALEAGTTIAVEPKLVFPGEAAVGIENTGLITDAGVEKLTVCSDEIFQI